MLACSRNAEGPVSTEDVQPTGAQSSTEPKLYFRLQSPSETSETQGFDTEPLLVVEKLESVAIEKTDHDKPDNSAVTELKDRSESAGLSDTMSRKEGLSYQVSIKLTEADALQFEELTEKNLGKRLGLFLDDELLVSALVHSKVEGGAFSISLGDSGRDAESSQRLAEKIASLRR